MNQCEKETAAKSKGWKSAIERTRKDMWGVVKQLQGLEAEMNLDHISCQKVH